MKRKAEEIMSANPKEKLRFILTCVFSVLFIAAAVFMAMLAFEGLAFEKYVPPDGISAFAWFLSGVIYDLAVPLFGVGILSMGLLAVFFAHSLKSHENSKIRKTVKLLSVLNICFLAVDILSIAIVLL